MCGRFARHRRDDVLFDVLEIDETVGPPLPPSWNIAPTQDIRVVVERPARPQAPSARQLRTMRWGLVPPWAPSPAPAAGPASAPMINARAETVLDKPSFRSAALHRRALVPLDGYYEWQVVPGGRVPHYLHDPDGRPLVAAAIYEVHADPRGGWLWSVAIVTTAATDALGHIHDRSPVLVPPELQADWLDPDASRRLDVERLLAAMPDPLLTPRRVGPVVGAVRADGPELIRPVEEELVLDLAVEAGR